MIINFRVADRIEPVPIDELGSRKMASRTVGLLILFGFASFWLALARWVTAIG
jgi:hypothetical protein